MNAAEDSNEQIDWKPDRLEEAVSKLQPTPTDPMVEAFFGQAQVLNKIKRDMDEIRERLNKTESQIVLLKKKTKPLKQDFLYVVIFGTAALFTFILVARGWAEKPTVSIDFNVGDIIGGLLVGVAAVFAALSYARGRTTD